MVTKAILFDVDGTLVDSNDLHARAWVDTFDRFGVIAPFEKVREQIGKGGDNLMPVFLDSATIDARGEEITAARSTIFKQSYAPEVEPFAEVRSLFQRAAADGWTIVLATSGTSEEIEPYLDMLDCRDIVSVVTTSDDAERSKPDPDIFAAAMAKAGVTADRAIVVGDSPYDMEAAGKLGIPAIAVRCGCFDDQTLLDAGAIALYDSPSDLLRLYALSVLSEGE
jgi:HAD superfamily hydrolase (TIGR01509 family)